jgi:hypothetical protein
MTTFLRKIMNTLPNELVRNIEESEEDVLDAIRRCKVNGNNAISDLEDIKDAYYLYSEGEISIDAVIEVIYNTL